MGLGGFRLRYGKQIIENDTQPFIQSHQFISHSWHDVFNFDLLSLNTRGIGGYKKRRKVFNYLKKYSSHNAVIFLQ